MPGWNGAWLPRGRDIDVMLQAAAMPSPKMSEFACCSRMSSVTLPGHHRSVRVNVRARKSLHPAVDRDVLGLDAAIDEQLLDDAVR